MKTRDPLEGLFTRSLQKPSDLLCCAFGLHDSEIDAYFCLLTEPQTVESISSAIVRDRSTTQRILNKLRTKGLVEREARPIEKGGYYYMYRAISTETVRKQMLAQLDKWYNETRRFLSSGWPQKPERMSVS
ncbi:MAG: TrmB family transcriptional regulator [Candidatus Thorarchaeota archaeon]|nr:MAG: TrmB family transcriptional regulator [Candidatus Thorarchaeota archaeon]